MNDKECINFVKWCIKTQAVEVYSYEAALKIFKANLSIEEENTLKKFEYHKVESYGTIIPIEKLNDLGEEGWELTLSNEKQFTSSTTTYTYLFKREKQ